MIPLTECKHGHLYRINCRNLTLGVFNEATKGFVGIREKFGSRYLFTEYHWDTGAPFGTVKPQELLEQCPIQNLKEYLGSECQECGQPVEFEKQTSDGSGEWKHLTESACKKARPMAVMNRELFKYLESKQ